jgi:hypothetical protein
MIESNIVQVNRRINGFSLTHDVFLCRQSSAMERNNYLSAWCPSQRIQHELCPSLSVVPFQCPKWYFSVADLYKDKHKHCNRFQVSVLFIQSNIRDFNIHVTIKNSTFVNLQVQSGKEHLGTYTRRRAADVARYIVRYRFSSDNADLRNFSLKDSSVLSMTNMYPAGLLKRLPTMQDTLRNIKRTEI